MNHQNIFSYQI